MKRVFESIERSLQEANRFAQGQTEGDKVYQAEPLDIKGIRQRVDMTQAQFAHLLGISLSTLRHWERGDRRPQGPARTLLNLIERAPEMVLKVLQT